MYHLILAPTHACNLRCKHCYLPDHSGYVMPRDEVSSLIQQWEEIVVRDRGPLGGYFHLKGGEPLMLPYLAEVLDILAEKATLRYMMTTNGTFLQEDFLDSLIRLNDAVQGNVIIIVSLDGSCEEVHRVLRGPNHFAKSEQFARVLVSAGINLHFNYVVHSSNLPDVPSFVQFADDIGATQINFLPMVPKGYGADLGDAGRPDPGTLHRLLCRLYAEGNDRRRQLLAGNYAHILDLERQGVHSSCECTAGYKGLFYVTPEGEAYSCPNLVAANLSLGNFIKTPLLEIHDVKLDQFYHQKVARDAVDDRYLCRGERLAKPIAQTAVSKSFISLPVIEQQVSSSSGYPDPARRLQDILIAEGLAGLDSGQGVSYCFSRNF